MLKIAGAILTVVAVVAIGGMLSLALSPVRAVRRLLPPRTAA